jgi:hypothetical protein
MQAYPDSPALPAHRTSGDRGNAAPHVSWPAMACLYLENWGKHPKKSGSGQVEVRDHEA